MDDSQKLLADYVKNGSESAFRELVARYIALVHSTALRLTNGDAHLAEDVTQTVFVDLARKARTLPQGVMLGGWLHRDTCFVAGTTMRGERRRHFRERQAVAMNFTDDHTAANLALVAPMLDEAINQLEPDDRTAILLRFFEQKEFRAVGEAMGSNEDAARMRVSRAVDKLHTLLKNRGVTFSAAALGAALAVGAVSAAPVGLAASVAGTALAAAATGGVTATILKFMTMTKLKIALVSAVAVAALAVPVVQHQSLAKLREANQTLQQQAAQLTPLQADNERLSNLVVQADTGPKPSEKQVLELARLRNEVSLLRQQSNDMANALGAFRQSNPNGMRANITRGTRVMTSDGKKVFHNIAMFTFAGSISAVLQAPVADQTGLTGTYDIEMTLPRVGGGDTVERVKGILLNELGLQLIPFAGPFNGGPLWEVRGTVSNLVFHPDTIYGKGFAIKLDHSGALGLKPANGEPFPDEQVAGSAAGLGQGVVTLDTPGGLPPKIGNKLRLIDSAKQQWALERNKQNTDTPTWEDISLYLGRGPNGDMTDFAHSAEGEYVIGFVGEQPGFRGDLTAAAAMNDANPPAPQDQATTDQDACINNLRLIDSAKQQWALEHNKRNTDTPAMDDIKPYLGRGLAGEAPFCPDGGVYRIGTVGEKPTCSIPGHVLP